MKQLKLIYECMMGCLIVVGGGFIIYHLDTTNYAVSRIEKLGGGVHSDTAWGSTLYEIVNLNDTPATDSDLKYVRKLQPYSGVYLRNTNITDQGLKQLHGLAVDEIDLTGTDVSNSAIAELLATIPADVKCHIIRDPKTGM